MPRKPQPSAEDLELRRDFGGRLRHARERLERTPAEMALAGGISMAHQYRIEAGERDADSLYMQKLVKRFGGKVVSLMFDLTAVPSDTAKVHVLAPGGYAAGHNMTINNQTGHDGKAKSRKPARARGGS